MATFDVTIPYTVTSTAQTVNITIPYSVVSGGTTVVDVTIPYTVVAATAPVKVYQRRGSTLVPVRLGVRVSGAIVWLNAAP